jgi:hypothetical protein
LNALKADDRDVIVTPGVGLAAARNLATQKSQTCAVLPLDADNRLLSPLILSIDVLERNEADIVHGPWRQFGLLNDVIKPPEMSLDSLVWQNSIDACALIRRDFLKVLGGWDTELKFWEDWDLWLGAVAHDVRAVRLQEVTFEYLVRPGSLSRTVLNDPDVHERVISHIAEKHAPSLGPTLLRLVHDAHSMARSFHLTRDALERTTAEFRQSVEQSQVSVSRLMEEHRADTERLKQASHQVAKEHEGALVLLNSQINDLRDQALRLTEEKQQLELVAERRKQRAERLFAEVTALRSRRVIRLVDAFAGRVRAVIRLFRRR